MFHRLCPQPCEDGQWPGMGPNSREAPGCLTSTYQQSKAIKYPEQNMYPTHTGQGSGHQGLCLMDTLTVVCDGSSEENEIPADGECENVNVFSGECVSAVYKAYVQQALACQKVVSQ